MPRVNNLFVSDTEETADGVAFPQQSHLYNCPTQPNFWCFADLSSPHIMLLEVCQSALGYQSFH